MIVGIMILVVLVSNVWTHSQPHVYERGWVYSVRIDMPSMSLQTFTVNIVTPR